MRRARKSDDHEGGGGHDGGGMLRWLLTYADMITLLMAFFIMMYSMSILNLAKFKEVAVSIRSGFGGKTEGGRRLLTHPAGQTALSDDKELEETRSVDEVAHELEEYIRVHDLRDSMRVIVEERGLVISIKTDNLLFPIGSADLRPDATAILDKIAGIIKGVSNNIVVEGHTCSLPISTEIFPSNWELSSARASRVVRCLIERYKLPAAQLAAAGYADTRPVASNNAESNRKKNRRVNIVILTTITSR